MPCGSATILPASPGAAWYQGPEVAGDLPRGAGPAARHGGDRHVWRCPRRHGLRRPTPEVAWPRRGSRAGGVGEEVPAVGGGPFSREYPPCWRSFENVITVPTSPCALFYRSISCICAS